MEVARAADPNRAAAVVDKLNALARQGGAPPQDFATALNAAQGSAPPGGSAPPPTANSRARKAETQLESVVLSQFIGEMLPKDAPGAFGEGYAGDMWRSMLAERVADKIAASGRLGIAQRLFASHPVASGGPLFSAQRSRGLTQAETAQASANALSSASNGEIGNGSFLFGRPALL
jgi:Rod binding domain-containing protein